MQSAHKITALRDTQFEGGAVFTEAELYTLQAAAKCAVSYWTQSAKDSDTEGAPALARLAKEQTHVHETLHADITRMLEGVA